MTDTRRDLTAQQIENFADVEMPDHPIPDGVTWAGDWESNPAGHWTRPLLWSTFGDVAVDGRQHGDGAVETNISIWVGDGAELDATQALQLSADSQRRRHSRGPPVSTAGLTRKGPAARPDVRAPGGLGGRDRGLLGPPRRRRRQRQHAPIAQEHGPLDGATSERAGPIFGHRQATRRRPRPTAAEQRHPAQYPNGADAVLRLGR
jgi:hypothetical protein